MGSTFDIPIIAFLPTEVNLYLLSLTTYASIRIHHNLLTHAYVVVFIPKFQKKTLYGQIKKSRHALFSI